MENYTQLNKDEKIQFWKEHFNRWNGSGDSQKKYCAENSVSFSSFKNWYAKFKPATKSMSKKFIKLKPDRLSNENSGKIEIKCNNRIAISVAENISESNLKKIFSALGY